MRAALLNVNLSLVINEQIAIQNLLRRKFTEIQVSNPRYSLRAFSIKIGVHVGALTYIMNGKRNVSRKLAERIARRLMLDPQERSEVLQLFPESRKNKKAAIPVSAHELNSRFCQLSAAQFKAIAEWEHFAIMSLVKCEDFQNETAWIAKRLGISDSRVRQVVDRLIELNILSLDESGRLVRTTSGFRTSDDVADISLKKHHDESLQLAKDSLHRDPVSARDITSITMAIDPKNLSMAKELTRKFQDELSDLLESGHRTEVYRLSMQLFPLSRIDRYGDQRNINKESKV